MTNPNRLNAPNREQWLASVTNALRIVFAAKGFTIPFNVAMSCGFPSKSATSRKKLRIGECWDATRSDGKVFEIFISPIIADPLEAAAILAHELIHATVGLAAAHGKPFAKCAHAIGLEGKMTATVPGKAFIEWFEKNEESFGPYPHARLNATSAPKKQTTRMVKCECLECKSEGNPYIVRLSTKALEIGAPICPVHETTMTAG
jgi:hypothetical protein